MLHIPFKSVSSRGKYQYIRRDSGIWSDWGTKKIPRLNGDGLLVAPWLMYQESKALWDMQGDPSDLYWAMGDC